MTMAKLKSSSTEDTEFLRPIQIVAPELSQAFSRKNIAWRTISKRSKPKSKNSKRKRNKVKPLSITSATSSAALSSQAKKTANERTGSQPPTYKIILMLSATPSPDCRDPSKPYSVVLKLPQMGKLSQVFLEQQIV